MFNILVTEDDKNTIKLIKVILIRNGFNVLLASNGEEALEIINNNHVDLLILDIMMPKLDGFQLTEKLRKRNNNVPILVISAKQSQEDKNKGFLCGVDDYITKPFDEVELVLRIKALLRRAKISNEHIINLGNVVLDYDSLSVKYGDEISYLPPKEFYLLYKFLSYPGKIFTRYELMEEIWGLESESYDNTVNVHVNRLRKRFSDYPDFEIVTIRGLGYKAVLKNE